MWRARRRKRAPALKMAGADYVCLTDTVVVEGIGQESSAITCVMCRSVKCRRKPDGNGYTNGSCTDHGAHDPMMTHRRDVQSVHLLFNQRAEKPLQSQNHHTV